MTHTQWGMILAIAVYLLGMVYIGYIYSKKTENAGDFYLGGRKLGPFVTAMSAEASDMSGWLLMGLPGVALAGSIAEAAWTAIGLAIGTYINWLIVARRIRCYTEVAGNSVTLPEFFENRYKDKSKLLRLFSALFIVIFFVPYTASGFVACGKVFATVFGAEYVTAMIISAFVIVLYTSMGGFSAASTTDFIQSIVMSIALIIVVVFGISNAGGISSVINNAKDLNGYFSLTTLSNWMTDGSVGQYNGLTIASTLAWGLGYFGMPHILLRFMAIEDETKLKLSRRVASIWVVIAMFVAIAIGVIGYSLIQNGTVTTIADFAQRENIIMVIATLISEYGFVFALVGGIILAGILASTMSTADSQLLAAASSISEDITQGVLGIKISEKKSILIARLTVIGIAIIGIFLALNPDSSVFKIVSFAWAGFGATFGPVVLAALFWKRSNKYGALAGMLSGAIMVFVWKFCIAKLGGVFAIYELLPAFIVACIAIIVVSLATKAPEKEITDEFEAVVNA